MILYVQTPSIPRSKLHNVLIKTMIEYLDSCKQFTEIKWFINIDAIMYLFDYINIKVLHNVKVCHSTHRKL